MKPIPTKIQSGATHWNPNAGPDWYCLQSDDSFVYYLETEGWNKSYAGNETLGALIPVEELMAQHNGANSEPPHEWNGEGLPPVGTLCRLTIGEWAHSNARITHMGKGVFCYEVSGTEYTGSVCDATFTPIKSEREKAIEAMSLAISRSTYLTKDLTNAIAAALYNEGYRKVEK